MPRIRILQLLVDTSAKPLRLRLRIYRLILVHGEKEFANLIFNEKEDVEKILELLKADHPYIQFGYVEPEKKKKKSFFSK